MHPSAPAIAPKQALLWLVPLAFLVLIWGKNGPALTKQIAEVSASEAKALVDSGAVVVDVDVRSEEAYGKRHLPGAVLIPLSQLQSGIPASLADAKDKPIVVYCNDGAHTGPEGTRLLNQAGYKGAVNLKSGIEGWQGAGYAIQQK